jgi:diacylglycerol O-acyltransferase / trehalose O-mycolyltransferase
MSASSGSAILGEADLPAKGVPAALPTGAWAALVVVLVSLCVAGCSSSQDGDAADRRVRVVGTQEVGPRLRDLTITSPALGRRAMVRLLLPKGFRADAQRRWPVLWLLHGCCDTYRSWTRSAGVERLPELRRLLVVMPEAGEVGFYSDWVDGGRGGPARWETFHLIELHMLLARDWRAGKRQAVAGVSMGGLGAMAYAARHPGMFRAAVSYSGLLNTRYQGEPVSGPEFIQDLLRQFGEDPSALWGDPRHDPDIWAQHNPYDLARHLHNVDLFVSVGDGQPGPLDRPAAGARARAIEQALLPQNVAFAQRLARLGIPVKFDAYSPGTHAWPYWRRALRRSLPVLVRALAPPRR